jgi:Zn-finger nucleic acid-binding protein
VELGERQRGESAPLADATKLCPKCNVPLGEIVNREVTFLGCEGCFGLWVDEEDLATFVERAATPESAASFGTLLTRALEKLAGGAHARRHCPFCRVPLARLGFGENPFIILDRCDEHGLWLDRTELKKVVRTCRAYAHPHVAHPPEEDDGIEDVPPAPPRQEDGAPP